MTTYHVELKNDTVKTLCAPSHGQDHYVDTKLSNFGLTVGKTGKKTFWCRYRTAGSQRRETIGSYPEVSPSEARRVAQRLQAQAQREDPHPEVKGDRRTKQRVWLRLADVVQRYMTEHVEPYCSPKTALNFRGYIRHLEKTDFWTVAIGGGASKEKVLRWHKSFPAKPTANRIVTFCKSACRHCKISSEAFELTKKELHREKNRSRFLTAQEVKDIDAKIRECMRRSNNEKGYLSQAHGYAILMILYTGARKGEITGLRWAGVSTDVVEVADYKERGGQSATKKIYLEPTAQRIMKEWTKLVSRGKDDDFVFATSTGKEIKTLTRAWAGSKSTTGKWKDYAGIRAELGMDGSDGKEPVVLHTFRHSSISRKVKAGMSLETAGAMHGHKDPRTTAKYRHFGEDELKKAAKEGI